MRATVTTTSSAIATNQHSAPARAEDWGSQSFLIKNMSGTKTSIFLEIGSAATASDGFEWETTDSPLEVTLEPGESLNAIVASGTQTLHVLRGGR